MLGMREKNRGIGTVEKGERGGKKQRGLFQKNIRAEDGINLPQLAPISLFNTPS